MNLRNIALAALLLPLVGAAAGVSIQLENGAFKLSGLASPAEPPAGGWASVFSVYAGTGELPPMLGSYSVEGGAVVFKPRFPLASGVRYRAVYDGVPKAEATFDGPKPASGPATRVVQVYPTSNTLPANQLRFYLYFSAPMQRGGVWEHIKLLDESGKAMDLPFLEIDQELWNADNTRLTVLFDPGRIKRGVTPEQEMGPPIVEGKRFTLSIDKAMKDARGLPLAEPFRKEFRGAAPIRTGIDLKQWKVSTPASGTKNALVLDFPRALEYGLLQHVFGIKGPDGAVKGAGAVEANETRWRFTPSEPWRAGDHTLVIDMALEDIAGNRIGRPFDVDVFEGVTERISQETKTLQFRIR